jgi:hypothetical protein
LAVRAPAFGENGDIVIGDSGLGSGDVGKREHSRNFRLQASMEDLTAIERFVDEGV